MGVIVVVVAFGWNETWICCQPDARHYTTAANKETTVKQQLEQTTSTMNSDDNNSYEKKEYLFHNPQTYDHEASLEWRGRCFLSYIGASGEHGMTFPQAVEKLTALYSKDTEDSKLVEDRWTRLFGQIIPGSELEGLLVQERAKYHEEHCGSRSIRTLVEHRERFAQLEQERLEKEELKKEAEEKKEALARQEEKAFYETTHYCAVCLKPADKACARCKNIFYCCLEHQRCDWKRHKNMSCKDPEVSEFFNGLSIMRGSSECRKFTDEGMEELTEEEYNTIAFPCRKITVVPYFSLFGSNQQEKTLKAPGGKNHFSVRDLARALAEFEFQGIPPLARCLDSEQLFGCHVYFEGLSPGKNKESGKVSFMPLYGS